jgi:hypothetical protein
MKETSLLGLCVACYSVIAGCLLFEGALLAFMGFPYWVSWPIFVTGCFWVLTCIAAVFETIRSRPIFVLVAACLLFLVSAVTMWFYSSEEKTLVWFLYQHCLELAVIIASLVLYFVSKKQGTVKFRPLP